MKIKKTILILAGYYLPGFKAGGSIRSIAQLVDILKDDFDFKIICEDRDLGDQQPYPNEPVGSWYLYGQTKVFRLPPGVAGMWMLMQELRRGSYDIVYVNGLWSRTYSILPMIGRRLGLFPKKPLVLAPRGQLSKGALGIKIRRKLIFVALARMSGLFEGVLWQASSVYEESDILSLLGTHKAHAVKVVPDIATVLGNKDQGVRHPIKIPGELRVATLGRVSLMKNIDYAIGLLRDVRGQVLFDIYGPLEDKEYVTKCREHSSALPKTAEVRFMGAIPHETVHAVLGTYDVFLLPTLGENFGHVILEAMSAGCVPVISNLTPWRDLQKVNAGWDLPLSEPDAFTAALQRAVAWSDEEYRLFAQCAKAYINNQDRVVNSVQENRQLFEMANGCM